MPVPGDYPNVNCQFAPCGRDSFLLRAGVSIGSARGLLSLAFHTASCSNLRATHSCRSEVSRGESERKGLLVQGAGPGWLIFMTPTKKGAWLPRAVLGHGSPDFFPRRMMRLRPGEDGQHTGRPFSTTALRAVTCCKLVTSGDTSPIICGGPRVGEGVPSSHPGST
jgi:hypothetical protein